MKKMILIFMLTCILPLTLSAQVCSGTMTSTTADQGDETKLDNSTHNDCVNADKASWAVDKIYFYTDVYCTEGKQTLTFLGDITPEKVAILQEVDYIFINGLKEKGLYDDVWQAGAMLLPIHSVGVMGDERTYEQVVALRAVTSVDGMTADWVDLPYNFLQDVSNDIINKVKGVNRVVYDISSKPPATIEWE